MEHRKGFFFIAVVVLFGAATTQAQIITYIDPVTDATIASKEIHTSSEYLVGAIAGSHSVTMTGGATYSIPIFSPPGTNGLQPSVALVYNSQSGDGPLGVGWSIAGLSAIARVGSDNYHDGVTAPVTFTAADHFALDGQRLVPTNGGNYGAAGTEYDTEVAQFLRVTTPNLNGDCPTSFKVQDKSCNVRWYGLDAQFLGNQSFTYSWHLNKIVDPFGNQVQYIYDMSSLGGPRVTEIRWGGTTDSFEGVNKIEFIYEERSDMCVRRTHAMDLYSTQLLSRLRVHGDGALVREYELRYAHGALDRSYLSEIVEYGLDGKQYNSTVFQYPNEEPWYVGGYDGFVEQVPAGPKEVLTGDFNGDGRMDRAYAHFDLVEVEEANDPLDSWVRNYTSIDVQLTLTGNPSWVTFDIPDPSNGLEFYGISGRSRQGFFLNDMDGDGRDDIVLSRTVFVDGVEKFALTGMWIWQSTATSIPEFSEESIGTPVGPYIYCNPSSSRDPVLVGDFTGDGRADVLALLHDDDWNQMHSYLRQWGQGWSDISNDIGTAEANHLGNCEMDRVADVDGDGKDEIVALQSDGWLPFRVIGRHANGTWGTIAGLSTPVFSYELNLHIGDLNGDGMQDLIYREAGEWKVRQGYGNGFTLPDPLSLPSGNMAVADLNNDGLADIFHATNQSGPWVVRTGLSRGSMLDWFTGDDVPAFAWQEHYPVNPMGSLVIGDRDGDGAAEVFSYVLGGQLQWFECLPFQQGNLKTVCDGMLNKTNFFYYSTRLVTTPYETTPHLSYPYGDYDAAIHVTNRIEEADGNVLTYLYGDGVAWKNGPGFIGFEKFSVTNGFADRRTESTLVPDPTWAILKPCTTRTYDDSEEELLSESVQMPTIVDLGPSMQRFTVHSEDITSTDGLSGAVTTVANEYNSTGDNIIQITTTIVGVQTTVEDLGYGNFGAEAPPGYENRLVSHEVTSTRAGTPSLSTLTTSTYDALTGALVSRTDFANTATPVHYEVLERFEEGVVKTERTSHTSDERITKYKYDIYRRATSSVKREALIAGVPASVITSYDVDLSTGQVLSTTTPDDLIVSNRYDGLGRPTARSAPYLDGQPRYDITTTMAWAIETVPGSIYSVTTADPGAPRSISFYDGLGRVLEAWSEGYGVDTWSKVKTTYQYDGRVHSVTDPALDGEVVHTTEYTYDDLGRPDEATHTLTGTTSWAYEYANGLLLTTTASPSGQLHKEWTDAAGVVVKAEDNGGPIRYEHNSLGQVLKVSHGAFTVMQVTYDEHGLRNKLIDQSAGTTLYKHDPFGQLIWQKSANGDEKNLYYDELGRLLRTEEIEGTVEYEYNHTGGRVSGKPTKITGFGSTKSFQYDALMRLGWSQLLTPAGASVEKEFDYDEFDRLQTNRYGAPLDMRVDREYSSTGHLSKIYDSEENVTYFRAASMDGLGHYTEYSLVDGHNSLAAFNGPFPVLYRTPNTQHLEMEWDPVTGNLNSRYDGMISRKELFAYDNLDRLVQTRLYETDGAGNLWQGLDHTDYDYDAVLGITKGNLITKDDVGRMGYAGHRVVSVVHNDYPVPPDAPPAVISTETQTISYTSYHQPYKITEPVGGGNYQLVYTYGPDHQRVYSELNDLANGPVETRLYDGDYERQYDASTGSTYHIVYVAGGNGLCAMVLQHGTNTEQVYRYAVYKDHLGSIVALSHTQGMFTGVVAEQSFDAWGRPRNPATWQFENMTAPPKWLYRGYTGHEHATLFALINMNGRMYDPVNGRMLSADNYVQGTHSTQGFNRYSYANNNPLKFTDPDGEWVHLAAAALLGGLSNWYAHGASQDMEGLKYFGIGAASAAIGAGVGNGIGVAIQGGSFASGFSGVEMAAFGGGFAGGGMGGFTEGFLTGFGNDLFAGGSFKQALSSGLGRGFRDGIIAGGIAGTSALVSGNSFLTGGVPFSVQEAYFKEHMKPILEQDWGKDLVEHTEIEGQRFMWNSGSTQRRGDRLPNIGKGCDPRYASSIRISRREIARFYHHGARSAAGTMYHEMRHAADYYSGFDSFIEDYYDDPQFIDALREWRGFSSEFLMIGTGRTEFFRYSNAARSQPWVGRFWWPFGGLTP